jgi:SAM-dependent methyltransferase
MLAPQEVVAQSYDAIADRYLQWTIGSKVRRHYVDRLIGLLPPGGNFLDLGCGAGMPVTAELAKHGRVTGVDISEHQLSLATKNVPSGGFLQADMAALDFPLDTFHVVASFYAITHVPRDCHADLFRRIYGWLRDGGFFLASLGAGDSPDITVGDWLGVPMFFSHFNAAMNRKLIRDAGFKVIEEQLMPEDGDDATFLWVLARKPRTERT